MDFPNKGPVILTLVALLAISLNKLLKNQLSGRWYGTPWRSFSVTLTHWGRCKMTAIWQTILSNAFSRIKTYEFRLTHWGRVTHICIGKLTIIGSDNGLSPGRRQAIIWTSNGILLIGPLGTNFSEILSEINAFSFKKMLLKMSSRKWRPFCLGLNVLTFQWIFLLRFE